MPYDFAIIGGGIHGAACADNLSHAGYKVIVLEQYQQTGLATSGKSSKLIHGGLRYLESAQFRLVRECLQQRQYLLDQHPDLVKLVPFYIPVYQHSHRKPWLIRLGLIIYSLLSYRAFKSIKKTHWKQLDNLKTDALKAVFQYYDGQTDDRLLTQRTMQQAQKNGAQLITNSYFISAQCNTELCTIKYRQDDKIHSITSRLIINASGPWVNHILKNISPPQSRIDIDLVAGTHIVINRKLKQGMYYLEAPQDKRAVFVMPWKTQSGAEQTLIGTTETAFNDEPEKVAPTEEEIDYLIHLYNHYFTTPLSRHEVVDSFAGLRVLPIDTGHAFHRSRDTIIHYNHTENPKVFSIYGGKLTAHRSTAQQLTKIVSRYLKQ
jgi:glycerol-3-phosphate dehydrogenase